MGGSIARALAACYASDSTQSPSQVTAVDLSPKVLDSLSALGLNTSTDAARAVNGADIVIIAVKPWLVENILNLIAPSITHTQLIASVAAGIDFEKLQEHLPQGVPLARIIPNTAVTVAQSMTFITTRNCNEQQRSSLTKIFEPMGQVMEIPENQIGACTALASCGIAFALRYIRASVAGGIELGVPPLMAQHIVSQTVMGAAALLLENGTHPEAEIDKVTTPGGITIRGLNAMEENGFTNAVIKGLKASH